MGGLGSWLVALAGPLAKQVLFSLGVGVVSFVGLDVALNALLNTAKASWGGSSATVAAYVAMFGGNTALSIIAGALIARISLIPLKSLSRL